MAPLEKVFHAPRARSFEDDWRGPVAQLRRPAITDKQCWLHNRGGSPGSVDSVVWRADHCLRLARLLRAAPGAYALDPGG